MNYKNLSRISDSSNFYEIKKGEKFKCIQDVPVPSGYGTEWVKGKIYESPEDGHLYTETEGRVKKPYPYSVLEYFEKIEDSHKGATEEQEEKMSIIQDDVLGFLSELGVSDDALSNFWEDDTWGGYIYESMCSKEDYDLIKANVEKIKAFSRDGISVSVDFYADDDEGEYRITIDTCPDDDEVTDSHRVKDSEEFEEKLEGFLTSTDNDAVIELSEPMSVDEVQEYVDYYNDNYGESNDFHLTFEPVDEDGRSYKFTCTLHSKDSCIKDAQVGEAFDNGEVQGKVLEIKTAEDGTKTVVVETTNEDGDIENVEVAIEDSKVTDSKKEPQDVERAAAFAIDPEHVWDLYRKGMISLNIPKGVGDKAFADAVVEQIKQYWDEPEVNFAYGDVTFKTAVLGGKLVVTIQRK